jgi:hypothetical protein
MITKMSDGVRIKGVTTVLSTLTTVSVMFNASVGTPSASSAVKNRIVRALAIKLSNGKLKIQLRVKT